MRGIYTRQRWAEKGHGCTLFGRDYLEVLFVSQRPGGISDGLGTVRFTNRGNACSIATKSHASASAHSQRKAACGYTHGSQVPVVPSVKLMSANLG